MLGSETRQIALESLRSNKIKTILTTLGVVIGSACIVLVVTITMTGKRYIISLIEGVGANLVYAQLAQAGSGAPGARSDALTLGDMEAVREGIPSVIEVAATRDVPASVVVEGKEHPITLIGVTEGFQRIRNLDVLAGRFLDVDDMASRAKVCLLTRELADLMFPAADPIGRSARVGDLRFTVVGVFEERVATFGQSEIQRESVVIPFPLEKYYAGDDFVDVLYAQAGRAEEVVPVTHQVESILTSRHRNGAHYRVQNLTSILAAAHRISLALTVVLLLVAFVALVISGIGIMNIMLVTVTERTREIGIRKALGAERREILGQFLLEAGMISSAGAVAGIVLAVILSLGVRPLIPRPMAVPISGISIVVAFVVSSGTGLLFGYLPARRAAGLHPTEALRHE